MAARQSVRDSIKDERRIQLIEATIASIAKRGFAETTLADVADAAKLSRGIVNFYFHSKDELLVETLRYLSAEYQAFWITALDRAGPDPATKLLAMIEADFDPAITSRKKVTVWYAFWGESRWRPEFLRICSELSDAYFAQTREICQKLVVAGGYVDVDAGVVARGLNGMIDGLWLDMLINPPALSRAEAKRVCRRYLAAMFPRHFAKESGAADAA
jgi:TetR/AcrR family transcriptional regulator, transcriptional repressor of bet genes